MTLYCIYVQILMVTVLTSASYSLFINILPEAICCCLQTCNVDVMLLLMDCVCILTFIVVTLLVV